jgi:hypothetical protein
MSKTKSICLLLTLFLIIHVSAAGQQALTPQQIRQVNKVRKNLAHYGTGTKLDVQLGNGSHKIGTLSQIGSTSFVLIDPVSSKSEAIDYLELKRVRPTRKEYMSQQLGKAVNGFPKVLGLTLLTVAVIAVFVIVN